MSAERVRCRDCRWWNTKDPFLADGYGVCLYASFACYGPGLAAAYGRDRGPGYLTVRQDFGCVQWEAKT